MYMSPDFVDQRMLEDRRQCVEQMDCPEQDKQCVSRSVTKMTICKAELGVREGSEKLDK